MMYYTTITRKGQMTIPKAIRDSLQLPFGKVAVDLDRSRRAIRFVRLPTLDELAGRFRVKNPKSAVSRRRYMQSPYGRD